MPKPASLSPDEILTAEFEYISTTAFQANEDRARVASFYLVTFGSFIAALLSAQFNVTPETATWVPWGFFGLFLALALMGLFTTLQLARLRLAWFESVQAMNAIKEYYIDRHPDLATAIKWRNEPGTLPRKFKFNSVGFFMVLQVAILGGAALGAGIFFVIQALAGTVWFLPAIVSGVAYFFILLEIYRLALK
jgi:hypothetical protein